MHIYMQKIQTNVLIKILEKLHVGFRNMHMIMQNM